MDVCNDFILITVTSKVITPDVGALVSESESMRPAQIIEQLLRLCAVDKCLYC